MYLSVAKHIHLGNYIRLASGEEGYVVDIDWRATRLRQLTNNTVLVPNVKLSQSIVTNYHLPDRELAVIIDASVDYSSDLDRVERITTEVAREVMQTVPGGVPGFEPSVRFHTFGDPGVGFSVKLRAKEFVDQFLIKHEFVKRLHKRFVAEGITIPIKSLARGPTTRLHRDLSSFLRLDHGAAGGGRHGRHASRTHAGSRAHHRIAPQRIWISAASSTRS